MAAKRYAPILGFLEETLAELSLLDRLLRSSNGDALRERANDTLSDAIVAIGAALEALAAYYRDPRNVHELGGLRTRLAHLQAIPFRCFRVDGSSVGASAEDQRTASVLVHTIADLAGSLAAAVDATVDPSPFDGRRRDREPSAVQAASTAG